MFNNFFPENAPQEKTPIYKHERLAIKRLQFKLPYQEAPFKASIHIPRVKKTFKTILKKQFGKQTSNGLISINCLKSERNAIGNNLKEMEITCSDMQKQETFSTRQEIKQGKNILLRCKRLRKLKVIIYQNHHWKHLHIEAIVGLESLTLGVTFPLGLSSQSYRLFDSLSNLRTLNLEINPEESDIPTLVLSLEKFAKFLRSSKTLEALNLEIREVGLHKISAEAMTELLASIGESNLSFFRIKLYNTFWGIKFNQIEEFLGKVEYLIYEAGFRYPVPFPTEYQKTLYLINRNLIGFQDIVTNCSSLKGMLIKTEQIEDKVPRDLGLAKNLNNFAIDIPRGLSKEKYGPLFSNLIAMLSEATALETFSLSLFANDQMLLRDLDLLHQVLSKQMIKNYIVELKCGAFNFCLNNDWIQSFFGQVISIQS